MKLGIISVLQKKCYLQQVKYMTKNRKIPNKYDWTQIF